MRGCLVEKLFEEIALAAQDIGDSRVQDIGEEEMSVEQDIGRDQVIPDSLALPLYSWIGELRPTAVLHKLNFKFQILFNFRE